MLTLTLTLTSLSRVWICFAFAVPFFACQFLSLSWRVRDQVMFTDLVVAVVVVLRHF